MDRRNNFDTIRMVASLAVLVSHAFPLAGGPGTPEPLAALSGGQTNLGRLAVAVFLVVSGYLITDSLERSAHAGRFIRARALRLLPGLGAMVLVVAALLGPVVSSLDPAAYFAHWEPYRYVLGNLTFQLSGKAKLPGVFEEVPFPGPVNGSLWSLRYEVECYALVLVLSLAGLLRPRLVLVLLAVALVAVLFKLAGHRATLGACFLGGAAIRLYRLPLRADVAAVCALVWLANLVFGDVRIANATVGAYCVLWLALSPTVRLPRLATWGDLSYGTYLWAFPVQQTVSLALGSSVTWALNIAIALPVTLALAMLSWHLIEAPALRRKAPGGNAQAVA